MTEQQTPGSALERTGPSTELELRREAPVARPDVDSWIGVVGNVAAFAQRIADTEFVPRNLRGKPAAVAAAILYGREIGLPPMTALTSTHVVEGRPSLSAEGMRAVVLAAGHELRIVETNGARCKVAGRRRGSETWTEVEWNVDAARQAGLLGKDVWKKYPRAMLQARATAELCRLVFPDVTHGMVATEELDDIPNPLEGSEPAAELTSSTGTVERTAAKRPARKRATPKRGPRPEPAVVEEGDGMPLPGEDGYEEQQSTPEEAPEAPLPAAEDAPGTDTPPDAPEAGEEPETVDAEVVEDEVNADEVEVDKAPPARPVSRAQLRMLLARLDELAGPEHKLSRVDRLDLVSGLIGRQLESGNDLTRDEASSVIDTLARVNSLEDAWSIVEHTIAHREALADEEPS